MKTLHTLLLLISIVSFGLTQHEVIHFKNPSFEGKPYASFLPDNWEDCGFERNSPPDTHPNDVFFVQTAAFDGDTYIGMVTRDNLTWERIGQQLTKPLLTGQCYGMAITLAKSPLYISRSLQTDEEVNFNKSVKLKIWGANLPCNGLEPLAESGVVDHTNWKEHLLILKPIRDYNYIILEAIYQDSSTTAYNGNLLLDYLSPIMRIPCEDLEATVPSKWYRLFRKQMKIEKLFRKTPSAPTIPQNPNEIDIKINSDLLNNPRYNWSELIRFLTTKEPEKQLRIIVKEKSIKKANRTKKRVLLYLEKENISLEKIRFDLDAD